MAELLRLFLRRFSIRESAPDGLQQNTGLAKPTRCRYFICRIVAGQRLPAGLPMPKSPRSQTLRPNGLRKAQNTKS
jgi:hypothetical protein